MIEPLLNPELNSLEPATIHTFLEGIALGQFKTFNVTFDGDLLSGSYGNIRRDQARHVALGMLLLIPLLLLCSFGNGVTSPLTLRGHLIEYSTHTMEANGDQDRFTFARVA